MKKFTFLLFLGLSAHSFAGIQNPPSNITQKWSLEVQITCKAGEYIKTEKGENGMEPISILLGVPGFAESPDLKPGVVDGSMKDKYIINPDLSVGFRQKVGDPYLVIGELHKSMLEELIQEKCSGTTREYFDQLCRERGDYNSCMERFKKYYTKETVSSGRIDMVKKGNGKISFSRTTPKCTNKWGPFDSTRTWESLYTITIEADGRKVVYPNIRSSDLHPDMQSCRAFNDGWGPR